MKYITVFCGSSSGSDPIYREKAYQLGEEIAKRGCGVVYGGAKVGLMGAVADGCIGRGGLVVGVLPRFLQVKELEHEGLSELHIVETMHERKAMMNNLSDAIIALPGGFGTMEELFEMLTWGQLDLHQKPIGLLNTDGYYDALVELSDHMIAKGFLKPEYKQMLLVEEQVDKLLDRMVSYTPSVNNKWFETK